MSTAIQDIPNLSQYKSSINALSNKDILITGATGGIGSALSLTCANLGAKLLLLGKNTKRLESLLKELSNTSNVNHECYTLDFSVAGEEDYIKFAEFLATRNKPLDALVLNAAYMEALQSLRNYQLDTWLKTITVNQHAPFLLLKCCMPFLEMSYDPSIVFSTHDCAKAYWGAYGVAKSAQHQMMQILANELEGDKPIRVNGVDPAPVRTKLRLNSFPGINPEKFPAPEEVIAPYLYFIGQDSKGITGINYKREPDFQG